MSKIFYNLYDKICNPLNLWWAYKDAARGKRYTPAVASFEYDLEKNLIEIEQELKDETYQLGDYHSFRIDKPKRRLVNAAPFRDRVVHHALMNIVEPLFERQFIFDSYANRKSKGTHAALDRATYFFRRYRYVMHLDVRQFFPSIDHEILLSILSRTVGDERAMRLVGQIISNGNGVQAGEYDMVYFPGDEIFAVNRPRGLPIGNLTSQHWANVYLNELDQYAKRNLKCRAYIRYVDDVLLFANSKENLHHWRNEIIVFLQTLRLTLHEKKAQPRPVASGIPFLGFTLFPDHRRLKSANGYAFQRRLKNMLLSLNHRRLSQKDFSSRLKSWINHASHGDTWNLKRSLLVKFGIYGGSDG
ncbi:MAG TPA: reverse transcriptase domain-containing protein [Anaerolineales bacterium]